MVREVFFVSIDADQVLESAGDARFLMSLEFRKVDNYIGIYYVSCDEVLMASG